MSQLRFISSVVAISLLAGGAHASDASKSEIEALRRQVEALTQTVTHLQRQVNQQRLAPVFSDAHPSAGRPATDSHAHAHDDPHKGSRDLHAPSFNPQVSVVIDSVASYSRSADNVNFIVRDAQLTFESDIGDLAHGFLVLNAGTELVPTEKTDLFEDASLELEEAAIETSNLPHGLQIRAGQFFADVTRLGKRHSHDLPFTDRPRSLDLIAGGETKARGIEVHWTPEFLPKSKLTLGVVDGVGAEPPVTRRLTELEEGDEEFGYVFAEADRRSFDNLTFYARATTTVPLAWRADLQLGANYLHGRDRGVRTLASADAVLSWMPRSDSLDLLEIGGEYLWSRTEGRFDDDLLPENPETGALLPISSTAHARGGYVYAQYRWGKWFQPGVRFDFVHPESFAEVDRDGDGSRDSIRRIRDDIFTYSAYANWHFNESNRLRLQLNYVKGEREITGGSDDDWQAFLQWTVILGSHEHSHE